MKKIKVYTFISEDGFISTIDGDIDWMMGHGKEPEDYFRQFRQTVDTVLFNEAHYLNLQSYDIRWPYDNLDSYLIGKSRFAVPDDRKIHFLPEDEIGDLHNMPGDKDIWLAGDHSLITTLVDDGMVDEITTVTLPVTLKSGVHLPLNESGDCSWKKEEPIRSDSGITITKYTKK